MKYYRDLVRSLPAREVVMSVGQFSPPSAEHQLLVQYTGALASHTNADCVVFVVTDENEKRKDPLSADRKIHYLTMLFPNTTFVSASGDVGLTDEINSLTSIYRKITAIVPPSGMQRCREVFGAVHQIIPIDNIDPDNGQSYRSSPKLRAAAVKGDFNSFKSGLPKHTRDIDARRLMNDVREGMGLEAINEQVRLPVDTIREKYFNGELYQVGSVVESINGESLEVIKRGTNYILVKDHAGKVSSKWLHDVVQGNDNG
jgi:hypothetical protein